MSNSKFECGGRGGQDGEWGSLRELFLIVAFLYKNNKIKSNHHDHHIEEHNYSILINSSCFVLFFPNLIYEFFFVGVLMFDYQDANHRFIHQDFLAQ